MNHNPGPPQRGKLVRLNVQYLLFKRTHQSTLLGWVLFMQQLVINAGCHGTL